MDQRIDDLINNWKKRNILGFYCENKSEAIKKILEIIPISSSIGISGSVTLEQLAIVKHLECRGNQVFNQYRTDISRDESLNLRRQGTQADYYLASANALAQSGELVFFSGYGNRTAGISYAPKVIVVSGINKLVLDLAAAIKRARHYASPLNCKRLNWNSPCFDRGICQEEVCFFPEYKRMCCQILIIEAEIIADRLKVILINENLGL